MGLTEINFLNLKILFRYFSSQLYFGYSLYHQYLAYYSNSFLTLDGTINGVIKCFAIFMNFARFRRNRHCEVIGNRTENARLACKNLGQDELLKLL